MNDGIAGKDKSKHPYNLPARFSVPTAVILTIIYEITNSLRSYAPVEVLYAIGMILYFGFRSRGENELGLSLNIPHGARKAIAITALCYGVVVMFPIVLYIWPGEEFFISQGMIVPERVQVAFGDVSGWTPPPALYQAFADKDLTAALGYMIRPAIYGVACAPVVESIFYFAVLFPAIFRRWGYRRALWIVSLLFMLVHVPRPLTGLLMTFVLATVFIVFYVRWRSLYPMIVLHACWNSLAYLYPIIYNWGIPTGK